MCLIKDGWCAERGRRQTEDVVGVTLASVDALTADEGKHGAQAVGTGNDGEHLCSQDESEMECRGVIAGGKPPLDGPPAATLHQRTPSLNNRCYIPSLRYIEVRNLAKRYFLFPHCHAGMFAVQNVREASL